MRALTVPDVAWIREDRSYRSRSRSERVEGRSEVQRAWVVRLGILSERVEGRSESVERKLENPPLQMVYSTLQ